MVSAVRPATIRSTGPLWRGWEQRSFAPCVRLAGRSAVCASWLAAIHASQRHQRRRHTNARDRLRNAGDGVRCGHRHLGVAQSVRGQRHKSVLRQGREVYRDTREGSGSNRRADRLGGSTGGGCQLRPHERRRGVHLAYAARFARSAWAARREDRDRHGKRRDNYRGAAALRRAWFRSRVPQRRTGRAEYQPQLRIDASRWLVTGRT